MLCLTLLLVSTLLAPGGLLVSARTQTVSYPPSSPTYAFTAPRDFVGLGFETAFLDNYANSPDDFAQNLVSSLSARTGGGTDVILRVGGTSGDRLTVNPDLEDVKHCKEELGDCPYGSSAYFELGPSYFDSFAKFEGVTWTFQAPLGGADELDIDRTLSYVRPAWEALGNNGDGRVSAIALGNEPQVYYGTAEEYLDAANSVQQAIIDDLGLEGDAARIFEWGETITGSAKTGDPYAIRELYDMGLGSNDKVKFAGEHYYQIPKSAAGGDWDSDRLQAEMMNHTVVRNTLENYIAAAAYLAEAHPEVEYVISESGAALGPPFEITAGFGSCLWSVDFMLTALSNGIKRVVDSGRPAAKHASFIPDDTGDANGVPGPLVQAPWAANIFVADFIGSGDDVDVSGVSITGDRLSAHVAYDSASGGVRRLALVNMRAWNGSTSDSERGEEVFVIPVAEGVDSVRVQRLHADLGIGSLGFDVAGPGSNITWAGQQWSYSVDQGKGHYVNGEADEETHTVEAGEAMVRVRDAEAVMIFIN